MDNEYNKNVKDNDLINNSQKENIDNNISSQNINEDKKNQIQEFNDKFIDDSLNNSTPGKTNFKKENIIKILLIGILTLILVALIIFIINSTKNGTGANINNDSKNDEIAFKKAEYLINKYLNISKSMKDCNVFETGFTDDCKVAIAYQNLKEDDFILTTCDDNLKLFDDSYYCKSQNNTISYITLNNTYQNLFGSTLELERRNYRFGTQYLYYKDNIESFINLYNNGETIYNYPTYEIIDAYLNGYDLNVDVAYALYKKIDLESDYSFEITLNNGEIIKIKEDEEISLNDYVKENLLDTYKFIFTYTNNNFYLKDFYKINSL